jgi:hypothetical protein
MILIRGAALGLLLSVGGAVVAFYAWGSTAIVPCVAFGLLATLVQLGATRLVLAARADQFGVFAQRWAIGMLLRLVGVALIPVAALASPPLFPAQPAAFGYLAVLLPLLYWETRLVR